MARLNERVTKLEGPKSTAWVPSPEGGVYYAGPRDPVAIMRALGLDHLPEVGIQVLSVGVDPNDPPRLAGDTLTETGRYGMSREFQLFAPEACRHAGSGGSWCFHWHRGSRGFVMDKSAEEWVRYFECPGDDDEQ